MRACWAATLLVLAQPSPAFCATCRGTSVVPQVLALTHRRLHKSPCVRQPFVETSGSIAFSSLCSFPGNCALFLCVSSRVHSILSSQPLWRLTASGTTSSGCPVKVVIFNQCRFENPQVREGVRIRRPSTPCFPFLLLGGWGQHIVQAQIHCGFGVVVGPSTG